MLTVHLEVFINIIISGHLSPESKEVFLIKIMFPALKTLANAAVGVIFEENQRSCRLAKAARGTSPTDG